MEMPLRFDLERYLKDSRRVVVRDRRARAGYCTMRVTVNDWEKAPEFAVTVMT